MYVGRPLPHKNLYRLIASYADLKKSNPGLKLVLAGKKDSGYKRVEKWVEDREINGVIFTDFVSEGQLKWLYQKCQAYIFPSLSEGFGLPGLEAMRHGAPVVSSNATCLPELYGDAAYYFDPTDVDDMTKTINKVLKDTELRKKLISEGNKQYKKYSWTRMATQTLEVYKRVLEET
jgi:glycosyltransferase involved in cell wall biosynthesis